MGNYREIKGVNENGKEVSYGAYEKSKVPAILEHLKSLYPNRDFKAVEVK